MSVAVTATAGAQASDSLLPRGGTWGAEAWALQSAGAILRFSSPRSAWLLGLNANVTHADYPDDGNGVPSFPDSRNSSGTVQLGHRWYSASRDDAGHLHMTYGLGALGTYSNARGGDNKTKSWVAGGYGEFGATWFFTRHLSLGAVGLLQATYAHQRQTSTIFTGPGGTPTVISATVKSWQANVNVGRLLAAVYF